MKRIFTLFVASLISFSSFAFAETAINKSDELAPISWALNSKVGNIDITNNTSEKQYVQIIVKTGTIGIFNKTGNSCSNVSLSANSAQPATVCALSSHESISLDNDYANGINASGTYQIAFSHTEA